MGLLSSGSVKFLRYSGRIGNIGTETWSSGVCNVYAVADDDEGMQNLRCENLLALSEMRKARRYGELRKREAGIWENLMYMNRKERVKEKRSK